LTPEPISVCNALIIFDSSRPNALSVSGKGIDQFSTMISDSCFHSEDSRVELWQISVLLDPQNRKRRACL
jgi:hypothetical protein